MKFDTEELEDNHDFIQWIFPTVSQSAFNGDAPTIDIKELRAHPKFETAKVQMMESLNLMLPHWGISDGNVIDKRRFKLLNGHNGMRLSRVLQSLVYHDKITEAEMVLKCVLDNIHLLKPKVVNGKTFWQIRFEEACNEVEQL
jgi:hypothetical protein